MLIYYGNYGNSNKISIYFNIIHYCHKINKADLWALNLII